jgi:6-pyruvoyltetrahydropterin/6-carboxytetrahydropterin synthase
VYSLTVSDHAMIAHSLPDEFFGPAANLHGATLTVEATFEREQLDEHAVVMDIGRAGALLDEALDGIRYRNLDDHPDFTGQLSTSEAIAAHLAQHIAAGVPDWDSFAALTITVVENPRARVSYRLTP